MEEYSKPKLWVFGDSFANCTGIASEGEKPERETPLLNWFKHKYDDYAWPVQLGKLLGVEVINKSKGGGSNEFILRTIIKYIPKMSPGDKVVVLLSSSTRIRTLIPRAKNKSYYSECVLPDFVERFLTDDTVDKEFTYALIDYLTHVITPHQDAILADQEEFMRQLGYIISQKNITTIYCKSWIWRYFESWYQFTDRDISDKHWSLNGNTRFAMFMHKHFEDNSDGKIYPFSLEHYLDLNNKPQSFWEEYTLKVKPEVLYNLEFLRNLDLETYKQFSTTNNVEDVPCLVDRMKNLDIKTI